MGEESSEAQPFTIEVGDDLQIVYDFPMNKKGPGATTQFENLVYQREKATFVRAVKRNIPHTPFTRPSSWLDILSNPTRETGTCTR